MLRAFAIALALACAPTLAAAQTTSVDPEPLEAELEGVTVTPGQLEEMATRFVEAAAAPARRRGLARWQGEVCIGASNFRFDAAQVLIDRISTAAADVALKVGEPGCEPNVLIVGADDARAVARDMVSRRRSKFFRYGYTRSNRGSAALDTFQTSEAAVRWWHVSLPINVDTGRPAIRLPGQPRVDMPCLQRSVSGGRGTLNHCNAISDRIVALVVIVDVPRLPAIDYGQLGDYLAMISLAQIEPDSDFSGLPTVLNLLDGGGEATALTDWDRAYLKALYSGEDERIDPREQAERLVDHLQ